VVDHRLLGAQGVSEDQFDGLVTSCDYQTRCTAYTGVKLSSAVDVQVMTPPLAMVMKSVHAKLLSS